MAEGSLKSRMVPMIVFLGLIGTFAVLMFSGSLGSPLAGAIAGHKLRNCFLGPLGLLIVLLLISFLSVAGWPSFRKMLMEMSRLEGWVLFAAMAALNFWIGAMMFEPGGLYHSMHRWTLHNYLYEIGGNMFRSLVPTAFLILTARPWRLVPETGLARTLSMASVLLLLSYIFAFLSYAGFQACEVE